MPTCGGMPPSDDGVACASAPRRPPATPRAGAVPRPDALRDEARMTCSLEGTTRWWMKPRPDASRAMHRSRAQVTAAAPANRRCGAGDALAEPGRLEQQVGEGRAGCERDDAAPAVGADRRQHEVVVQRRRSTSATPAPGRWAVAVSRTTNDLVHEPARRAGAAERVQHVGACRWRPRSGRAAAASSLTRHKRLVVELAGDGARRRASRPRRR